MTNATVSDALPLRPAQATTIVLPVVLAVSFCHLLNDMMQSLLAAIYPVLKVNYGLDFTQIGILAMAFQVTASLLQPVIGMVTDRRPMPYSLPVAMAATLAGLLTLAFAHSYGVLLAGFCLVGLGSAIFHPESSRVARLASGGRHGLAQSLFQVGGNFGTAFGPLLAAFIVLPGGQGSVAWFSLAALVGMIVLYRVGAWYAAHRRAQGQRAVSVAGPNLPRRRIMLALVVLALLVSTKNVYMASLSNFYTFYAIEKFGTSVQGAQLMLFVFLGASAVGTVLGGPIGDRFGNKFVIWLSILGTVPFTLALPYADMTWCVVLTVIIGLVMSSAFPAIVVFAQELVPGRVGTIAGIFFGFAFGMGGLAAALLGSLADRTSLDFVFWLCAFLPLLGLTTALLPDLARK